MFGAATLLGLLLAIGNATGFKLEIWHSLCLACTPMVFGRIVLSCNLLANIFRLPPSISYCYSFVGWWLVSDQTSWVLSKLVILVLNSLLCNRYACRCLEVSKCDCPCKQDWSKENSWGKYEIVSILLRISFFFNISVCLYPGYVFSIPICLKFVTLLILINSSARIWLTGLLFETYINN